MSAQSLFIVFDQFDFGSWFEPVLNQMFTEPHPGMKNRLPSLT